jgi:hypothetical protein
MVVKMIPTIEEIFRMLSLGEMSYIRAEDYVREHIKMGYESENIKDLRVYIAVKAMQAMLSNPGCTLGPLSQIPSAAFEVADAMIKESDK